MFRRDLPVDLAEGVLRALLMQALGQVLHNSQDKNYISLGRDRSFLFSSNRKEIKNQNLSFPKL